jgi:hypothetical protein
MTAIRMDNEKTKPAEPKLMPCPWCGAFTMVWNMYGWYFIAHQSHCPLYHVRFICFTHRDPEELTRAWNGTWNSIWSIRGTDRP